MNSPQTTTDWLNELRHAAPALRQRKWAVIGRKLRTESEQCILCCLAEVQSSAGAGYIGAWKMALSKSYPDQAMLSTAQAIALASDAIPAIAAKRTPLQAALLTIVGLS